MRNFQSQIFKQLKFQSQIIILKIDKIFQFTTTYAPLITESAASIFLTANDSDLRETPAFLAALEIA